MYNSNIMQPIALALVFSFVGLPLRLDIPYSLRNAPQSSHHAYQDERGRQAAHAEYAFQIERERAQVRQTERAHADQDSLSSQRRQFKNEFEAGIQHLIGRICLEINSDSAVRAKELFKKIVEYRKYFASTVHQKISMYRDEAAFVVSMINHPNAQECLARIEQRHNQAFNAQILAQIEDVEKLISELKSLSYFWQTGKVVLGAAGTTVLGITAYHFSRIAFDRTRYRARLGERVECGLWGASSGVSSLGLGFLTVQAGLLLIPAYRRKLINECAAEITTLRSKLFSSDAQRS